MKDLKSLIRPNIQTLCRQFVDTEHAIDKDHIALDRCESPFNAPLNRKPYPDELNRLKTAVAIDKKITPEMIALSVGDNAAGLDSPPFLLSATRQHHHPRTFTALVCKDCGAQRC